MTKRWWSRASTGPGETTTDPSAAPSWEASRCPTCGRAHPLRTDTSFEWFADEELDQIELQSTDPIDASRSRAPDLDDAVVSDTTADLNSAPRWVPAALVVAAVAGLAALLIFSGGAETTEQAAETPAETAVEPTSIPPTTEPAVDAEAEAAIEAETQRQRHEVASIWARTLVPAAAATTVVYRTENSVALVDLAAGEQSELPLDVPIDLSTDGFAYLTSDRGTWVVNPSNPVAALRLAPQAEIGPLSDPTASIVLPERGARFIMLSQHDGRIVRPIAEIQPTSEVLIVGGRGAIVTPPTGGSSLVSALGAERLTEGRVLTANHDYLVELRCQPLTCGAVARPWPELVSAGDDVVATDDPPTTDPSTEVAFPGDTWTAATIALSPNGEWLFVADEAAAWELFDLRTGVAEMAGSGTDPSPKPATAVVWAPDSSYFVFMDDDGLVVGSPEVPTALAKVPLQFPPAPGLVGSEMMVIPG